MTFRSRLLLGLLVVALVPLAVLAFGVRRETSERLRAQYERRVQALSRIVEEDIASERALLGDRLEALAVAMADDNDLRAALHGDASQRAYLLDYANGAMRLAGLEMLQLQDETGRILSSGHFRQEYDRLEPELPMLLAQAPEGAAIVRARAPDGPFLALASARTVEIGLRTVSIVGGVGMEQRFLDRLARDTTVRVTLLTPDERASSDTAAIDSASVPSAGDPGFLTGDAGLRQPRETAVAEPEEADDVVSDTLMLPMIVVPAGSPARLDTARLVIDHSISELSALQSGVDLWFLAAAVAVALGAVLLAALLASRLGSPIADLAGKAERLDLDRLDADFRTDRTDEVGQLSRTLGAMTSRLRASAGRLREAERRMAVGEVARQVNHDIKNGLAPIRHVLRHLTQVAREQPAELPAVFLEREGTIEQSVAYLETLAANYAKLSPRSDRSPGDVNAIATEVVRGAPPREGVRIETNLASGLPSVRAEAVLLRRILENLVSNAVESLENGHGDVSVETSFVPRAGESSLVRIVVADTGKGMSERELARAFDDFFTTKAQGTGLGLSIVRRLVADLEGTLRVETGPGTGSRFTIELPAAVEPVAPRAVRHPQPTP